MSSACKSCGGAAPLCLLCAFEAEMDASVASLSASINRDLFAASGPSVKVQPPTPRQRIRSAVACIRGAVSDMREPMDDVRYALVEIVDACFAALVRRSR